MARFKENDVIQAKANLSLWSLAVKDASRLAIARAGGIQLVIESMRRFPENLVVIEAGHGALWNLARDEENRNLISQMSGVDILIQNLARFNCDVDINVRGLGALWSLNDVEANREKLIKMGGINIIANAIKNLSEESTEIAENGFGCLLSMSKSDIAKQAMMDSKVVSLVISYMKKYSDNKIIAEKGNGLLWDISRNMSYIPIISEEGKKNFP